jgi:hypothetical protein
MIGKKSKKVSVWEMDSESLAQQNYSKDLSGETAYKKHKQHNYCF